VGGRSTLAFQATSSEARLQWYDREGKPLGSIGPVTAYLNVKLSPDGKQVLPYKNLNKIAHLRSGDRTSGPYRPTAV
jgi:hypothetical protein